MVDALVVIAVLGLMVLLPLAWLKHLDRQQARALEVQARLQHLVDRALGGASYVAVRVTPPLPRARGRVEVTVPAGWEQYLTPVWAELLQGVPARYELVVSTFGEAARPAPPLDRAA